MLVSNSTHIQDNLFKCICMIEWRRHLWAWVEELLVECRTLLHDISFQTHLSDQWQWQLDPVGGYALRGVSQFLTSRNSFTVDSVADLIWHKHVPLKISIFAWRLHLTNHQQNQIWCLVVSSFQKLATACPVVKKLNQLNTCLFRASLLVLFGC